MNTDFLFLCLAFFTVASLFLSLVFIVGIVWRVEMELDLSFKFLTAAVVFLLLAEIISLVPGARLDPWSNLGLPVIKLLAAANLLFGLFFMRDLVRRANGERGMKKRLPTDH